MYAYIIELKISDDKIIKIKHVWLSNNKILFIDTENKTYYLKHLLKYKYERNIYCFAYILNYIKNYKKQNNIYKIILNKIKKHSLNYD